MSEVNESGNSEINIVLPKKGVLCQEETPHYILCKPKLLPLKSLTLEKLEKMQKDAEEKLKEAQESCEVETSELQETH